MSRDVVRTFDFVDEFLQCDSGGYSVYFWTGVCRWNSKTFTLSQTCKF